jgi:cellulose synthase/poly-beta-1,6-N-acetylglucosamine synthase-like glycosyltransferase
MIGLVFWFCVGSIVYIYAGYPALLALLARLRPQPRPYESTTPSVTLIIAAYNEQDVIAQKIANSLALDYPPEHLQIIVAADGSDDQTPEIVRTYDDQRVELSYSPERRGKVAAINRAAARARGDILVFSDANNRYNEDALNVLTAPFSDPTVGVVTGSKAIDHSGDSLGASEGLYWKYESFMKQQETRLGCCVGVVGEMIAVRRDLFEPLPEYVINDDFYIAMRPTRRGYRVVYEPRAQSYERVSLSEEDEITRRMRMVAGHYQSLALAHEILPLHRPLIVWQALSHKLLRPMVALAMAGALASNIAAVIRAPRGTQRPLLRLAPPFNWVLLVLQVLFYATAWIGGRKQHTGIVGKLLYIPTFLVNSNIAAAKGLYRFLSGKQTVLWKRVKRTAESQPAGPPASREGA